MICICCYCQSCCVCDKPLLFLLKCSGNLCFAGGLIWTKVPQFHSCPYPKCHGDLPRRWREKGIGGMVKRAFSFLCLAHPCKVLSRATAYNSRHEIVLLPLEITLVDLGKGAGPRIHSSSWVNCSGVTWPNPHPAISMVGMPVCIWDIATWWFGTSQAPRGQQVRVISGCNTLRPWHFCLPTMDLLIKLCGKTVGH